MTQFETNLRNLKANLEAEKESYKQERWSELRATKLAAYRQQQEKLCNEGITVLQKKKEEACLQKEDELKTCALPISESLFGTAAEYLTKALSAFEQGGGQK